MRSKKGLLGLALLAILALTITTVGATATASGGSAVAAKKKCKKIKNKAKRKKCKKKQQQQQQQPAPLVRATLTWTGGDANDADLDLFVFDANGNRAGNGSDTIPSSTISTDASGTAGTETFTDLAPQPLRSFSFGVCYTVGGSAHTPFTITYITADGVSHTDSQNPGSSFHYDYPGGAPIPSGYCPN